MENEIQTTLNAPMEEKPKFKGYTLQQIRYQRAVVALHKEYSRAKITNNINKIKGRSIFSSSKGIATPDTWVGKFLSGMNIIDYALLGFSAFSSVKKILSIFKRKK